MKRSDNRNSGFGNGFSRRSFLAVSAMAAMRTASAKGRAGQVSLQPIPPNLEDLARNRPVSVSSTAYGPYPGFCAVDGSDHSYWISAAEDPSSIQIDLQAPCMVRNIRVVFPLEAGDPVPAEMHWTPSDMVLGGYAVSYAIDISENGHDWQNVFHTATSGVGGELHLPLAPITARYVRLLCAKRSYPSLGIAIARFEVYGKALAPRPAATGWTQPPATSQRAPLAGKPDGHGSLITGWQLAMAGPGGVPPRLSGKAISSKTYSSRGWRSACVPGTVLTSLVADKVFPDPLFGLNNLQIPEALNKYAWWYRQTFKLDATHRGKRIWLEFSGINFTAEVWLNAHFVGNIKGAFTRARFDITNVVHLSGSNVLAVKIHPVPHPGLPNEQSWATGAGPNGGQPARDGPNFYCTVGWDWIPGIRDRDSGLWDQVRIRTSGDVVIENPHITTDLPLPDVSRATLGVSAEVFNATDEVITGVLRGKCGAIHISKSVTLRAGQRRLVKFSARNYPALVMKDPILWWPNGYGAQHMYGMSMTFEIDGSPSDAIEVPFGVRKFEYRKSPALIILCNGHRIMARGGNWGLDEAMKRIDWKNMHAWIRMHHLANLTIIRNWTGESNSEDFFALCDRYGLMVWTEFWMANPYDGPAPDDPGVLLANAADTIKRYRNHPSIAIWCGRNEGTPPAMINNALRKMVADFDGTRYYQPGSSFAGVQSGGPYHFQEPEAYYAPQYDGFKTEIGSVSVPTLDSLRTTMPEADLWPNHTNTWAYHDYCVQGAMNITTYEKGMFDRFGKTETISDFVRRAQILNYEVYRGIFEGYLHKLWKNASGTILWMSHPAQHSTVWQLYAHDLEAHASLYGAKKACGMIHVQLSPVDGTIDVINHHIHPLEHVTIGAAVHQLDGTLVSSQQHPLSAPANSVTHTIKLKLPASVTGAYLVRLTLHQKGKLLADNFYWKGRKLTDLAAMNHMAAVRPTGKVSIVHSGDQSVVTVQLKNESKAPAIEIKVTPRKHGVSGPASRILPVFISDNYFSLLPGETKTITADYATADAETRPPMLEISGFNVPVQTVACDGGAFTGG